MVATFKRGEDTSERLDLPCVGAELSEKVSILLKTNDDNDPAAAAQLIHQAHVRRDVVIKLIEGMVARKHRAYMSVNMASVKQKAQLLPERGVPPEIVKLLPFDEHLDKIQIQKSATPVEGRGDTAPVAEN